jgi:regulator of sigma E protease
MLSWIAPIIVFVTVIFVHEFGHFLAAKAFGVYAPRFSIGFGPALFRKKWGETEYVIAAIPLGGFVRMASRSDESELLAKEADKHQDDTAKKKKGGNWDENAMAPFGPKPIPSDRWLEAKPLWNKVVILLAGVTMNMLLAFGAMIFAQVHYGKPYASTSIMTIQPGKPAAMAGMIAGDSIIRMNDTPITAWDIASAMIVKSAGKEMAVTVVHGKQTRVLHITPEADTTTDPATGHIIKVGRFGVYPAQGALPVSLKRGAVDGWNQTWGMVGTVASTLRGLATRQIPTSELGGPIMIVSVSVQAAKGGIQYLLLLISFISVNLAVFNLLPVPILDGGQVALAIIESAKGSAFSDKAKENMFKVGLVAILLLLVLTTYNDLHRFIIGWLH